MARKQSRPVPPMKLPERLVPDYDHWGTPTEEAKRALLDEWLRENDLSRQFFFSWAPTHLAERRRLAGLPPRVTARRKGRLPESVRRLLADLETERKGNDRTEGGSHNEK